MGESKKSKVVKPRPPKQISEVKTIKICSPQIKKYSKPMKNEIQYRRVLPSKYNNLCKCLIKYTNDGLNYKNAYVIKNCFPKHILLKNFKMNTIWALNLKSENLCIYKKM